MRRAVSKLFSLLACFVLALTVFTPSLKVEATLQDDLAAVQQKLKDIQNQKASIQNSINSEKNNQNQLDAQIATLKSQIDLLDNQIQEKELVVQELDLQIQILTQNIETTTAEITQAESDIQGLQDETDQRMVDMYISEKTMSQLDVFFTKEGSDIIKYDAYQVSFQKDTNDLIQKLNAKRTELNQKKSDLEANKLQVVNDQTQMNTEKIALTESQSQLDQQRADYVKKRNASLQLVNNYAQLYASMSASEKKAEEQQNAILSLIMAKTETSSGVFVKAGTFIGIEGSTGNSTGIHTHFAVMVGGNINTDTRNPCDYLPYNVYPGNGDDNCDHKGNGQFIVPLRPTGRLTSGYRPWYRPSHLGIDISTGHNDTVVAAHDGYVYYGYENGGWGNYVKICVNNKCSSGIRTIYAHLKCTSAPKGSSGSCGN